jgi:hypothetical protein
MCGRAMAASRIDAQDSQSSVEGWLPAMRNHLDKSRVLRSAWARTA